LNSLEGLSINLATVREQFNLAQAVDACVKQGLRAVAPWRDQVQAVGLKEAAAIVRANGLRVTGLCRGGMFPAADEVGRAAAIEDNKRAIDEACTLGADCLVLVVGGLAKGSKDIAAARQIVVDGIGATLDYARTNRMKLAIEPLHPMYAADRACINTLEQALDVCDVLDDGQDQYLGVAIDAYHVWWDPKLAQQIARAGAAERIFAHHICDWLVPTRDLLLDRGMMGDGVIDLRGMRRMIEAAGFKGPQEVEIFSAENWWKKPGDQVIATCIERYRSECSV